MENLSRANKAMISLITVVALAPLFALLAPVIWAADSRTVERAGEILAAAAAITVAVSMAGLAVYLIIDVAGLL
jgi:uncharacterized membrane protein YozB (DUF420 family)